MCTQNVIIYRNVNVTTPSLPAESYQIRPERPISWEGAEVGEAEASKRVRAMQTPEHLRKELGITYHCAVLQERGGDKTSQR